MKGRTRFTSDEAARIRELLREKDLAPRARQKVLRARLRQMGFFTSNFAIVKTGFTCPGFEALVESGDLIIEDESSDADPLGMSSNSGRFRFSEIEERLNATQPGLYEIYTLSGIGLKVGIALDLLERLKTHRASRDSGLKLSPGGSWSIPADVESKSSVLAKHLYFDQAIAPGYDLRTERGRRAFLSEGCEIEIVRTSTKADAKKLEKGRESSGEFRYVGDIVLRVPRSDH